MKEIKFRKGIVGSRAYKTTKVWKLGFHVFLNGEHLIVRFCYFRSKTKTYYCDLTIKVREQLDCERI